MMFQIRIHGRGGQGVVSGAELLSVAAFIEGRHAQAFPSFGSERMGAPVMAFCRIDDKEIRLREPVLEPDALIIQDATLLHQVDLFNGLPARGVVLINSAKSLDEIGLGGFARAISAVSRLPGPRDRARPEARRTSRAQRAAARRVCRRDRQSSGSPRS